MAVTAKPTKRRTTTTVTEEYGGTDVPGEVMPAAADLGISNSSDRLSSPTEGSPAQSLAKADAQQPSRSGMYSGQPDSWLANNWGTIAGFLFTAIATLVIGSWYVSKFDTKLERAEQEIKTQTEKTDRVKEDIVKFGLRLENLEKQKK